jgi:hypothetical protein
VSAARVTTTSRWSRILPIRSPFVQLPANALLVGGEGVLPGLRTADSHRRHGERADDRTTAA